METNSIITGCIPGNQNGIHKTYEESFLIALHNRTFLYDIFNKKADTYLTEKGNIVISDEEYSKNMKRVELLNVYPIASDTYFVCEFIEPEILHRHLLDERLRLTELGESYGRK